MPFVAQEVSGKGVFQQAETDRERITVKFGSDLVVGDEDVNTTLLQQIALQALVLHQEEKDLVVVTSGAVKYGRIIGRKEGRELTKVEAAFVGFDALMLEWQRAFESVGLLAMTLAVTGQSLNKKYSKQLQQQVVTSGKIAVVNTHDGLNLSRYKYHQEAANNDVVGERLAQLFSSLYIVCTNTDGVQDKNGESIRQFQSLEQLNDITFYQNGTGNGTGGMETKLHAAIRYSQSVVGRSTYIVNGQEENVLLKAVRGQEVGTKVQILAGDSYVK